MMHRLSPRSVLLLDISRLIWRARRKGPTGIDRVELAYAQHFIVAQGERPGYAVLHLVGFVFAISPTGGRRFIEALAARWQGNTPTIGWENLTAIVRIYWHFFSNVRFFGPWFRTRLRNTSGAPIFLVVSHHHVARAYAIQRIRRTLGAQAVCFIHDLLPLDYPEYFKPGWERRYHCLKANVVRLFDGAIVNSESTAGSLRGSHVNICVAAPGVRPFQVQPTASRATGERPYFVVLGTIEPRKNHLLLLNLWARLASKVGPVPRLLVIGARGWENEQVVDMLERSRRLRGLVEECNGLSDAAVGAALSNARALLLPSFAEGFGLPLAEALATGIPVICSDISVFREVGRDAPEYLDPLDLQSWSDAVLDYSRPDSVRRAAQIRRLTQWRAPRWSDHFKAVEQMLGELEASRTVLPGPLARIATASRPSGSAAIEHNTDV